MSVPSSWQVFIEIYTLSPAQVGDFLHPSGSVSLFCEEAPSTRHDSSLLSSLYNYWLLSDGQSGSSKTLTPSEIKARKAAMKCVKVSMGKCIKDTEPSGKLI